jgi:hypothetical protein
VFVFAKKNKNAKNWQVHARSREPGEANQQQEKQRHTINVFTISISKLYTQCGGRDQEICFQKRNVLEKTEQNRENHAHQWQ